MKARVIPALQVAAVDLLREAVGFVITILNKRGAVWKIKPVSHICTIDFS